MQLPEALLRDEHRHRAAVALCHRAHTTLPSVHTLPAPCMLLCNSRIATRPVTIGQDCQLLLQHGRSAAQSTWRWHSVAPAGGFFFFLVASTSRVTSGTGAARGAFFFFFFLFFASAAQGNAWQHGTVDMRAACRPIAKGAAGTGRRRQTDRIFVQYEQATE
jgi:hypothetical protein